MPAYAIWLNGTTTPPTATVAQVPDALSASNSPIGACLATQPTQAAQCIGTITTADKGASLPSPRWTPLP